MVNYQQQQAEHWRKHQVYGIDVDTEKNIAFTFNRFYASIGCEKGFQRERPPGTMRQWLYNDQTRPWTSNDNADAYQSKLQSLSQKYKFHD